MEGGLRSALAWGSFASTSGMSSIASRMLASDASTSASLSPDLTLILTLPLSSGIDEHDNVALLFKRPPKKNPRKQRGRSARLFHRLLQEPADLLAVNLSPCELHHL